MKLLTALLAMGLGLSHASDSKLVSNIMSAARPLASAPRFLESNDVPDISGYYLHFRKCAVRSQLSYGDDDGAMAVQSKKFAIFRLCSSCSKCAQSEYAEYIVDLETYARQMTEYYKRSKEESCEDCYDACVNDDDGNGRRLGEYDCSTCVDECQELENMEDNGYEDAGEYMECVQLEVEDNDDDAEVEYYAGPKCSNSGKKIKLAVYTDAYCTVEAEGVDVETFLGYNDNGYQMQIDYTNLNLVNQRQCISCLDERQDENDNGDDGEDEVQINDVCKELYADAGRCESPHGFSAEYMGDDDQQGQDQYGQEDTICSLIEELVTLDSSGQMSAVRKTTTGQKLWIAALLLGTVAFAACACMFHRQAVTEKVDLSYQGGAMS